jgi:hypothetical protein
LIIRKSRDYPDSLRRFRKIYEEKSGNIPKKAESFRRIWRDLRLTNQLVDKIRAARDRLQRFLVAVRADKHAAARRHLKHVAAIGASVFDGHAWTMRKEIYKVFESHSAATSSAAPGYAH